MNDSLLQRIAIAVTLLLGFACIASQCDHVILLPPVGCDTGTVECWPDPAIDGWACKCTRGATPPTCVDLGSCAAECPAG